MNRFKLAVAQIPSLRGDIDANIVAHLNAIIKAGELGVSYLLFPELSITGYEPELAKKLAFSKNDMRLQPLIDASIKNNVTLAIGAPLVSTDLPKIGLIIICPSGAVETYQKMNLHPGEDRYFSKGNRHHYVDFDGTKVVNAICADTNNAEHALYCAEIDARIYVASVLIGASGYDADTEILQRYAEKYNLLVAMANHNRATGDWEPVGKSAIWSNRGLLVQANERQNALLVAEKTDADWTAQLYEI